MIATVRANKTVVYGPKILHSATDGVIQLSTVGMMITATAGHIVQRGQFGQCASADRIANAIAARIAIESAAMILPNRGQGLVNLTA